MNIHVQNWAKQYERSKQNPVYPTEWIIRTIAGADYPNFKYDKGQYRGKKILDISCGDGRNLQLLLNLGFDVYATETSEESVRILTERFPSVKFRVGFNHKHPFPDGYFDYALACFSFYYLEPDTHFSDNLKELNRILKPGAIFYVTLVTKDFYVLQDAIELGKGEYLITNDPHKLRNGYRWHVVNSREEIQALISPYLKLLACSKLEDDYFGYFQSNYILVTQNQK